MPNSRTTGRQLWVPVLSLLVTLAAIAAFYITGAESGGYSLPTGDTVSIPAQEMRYYAWYALYAGVGLLCAFAFWYRTSVPQRMEQAFAAMSRRPWLSVGIGSGFLLVVAVLFRYWILLSEPITDDELTYRFIAQTLLEGRFTNPPPIDPAFLHNTFVIANADAWYGKYPIGHPLFLAIGEVLSLRGLIVPLLGAASMLLTFAIGRRLFSPKVALAGTLLLLASPQFVWTNATELSQPTELFCVLLGTWCLLAILDDLRLRWALLGGAAFGMAVLVRPVPGVLCVLIAGAAFLDMVRRESANHRARVLQLTVAVFAMASLASLILIVNRAQSGDALHSGYHTVHASQVYSTHSLASITASLGGTFLRQNFWLFGVPLSLLLVPMARPTRGKLIFWGMILAVYAYRVIVPKTVVSTTGPVYVFEAVPFLCLATASGFAKASVLLAKFTRFEAKRAASSLVLSVALIALLMFTPLHLQNIMDGANSRQEVLRQLDEVGATNERVLVLASLLARPGEQSTWAFAPPNPRPDLSDRVIFLRIPGESDAGFEQALSLWKRVFPDRRAFFFGGSSSPMRLSELER